MLHDWQSEALAYVPTGHALQILLYKYIVPALFPVTKYYESGLNTLAVISVPTESVKLSSRVSDPLVTTLYI